MSFLLERWEVTVARMEPKYKSYPFSALWAPMRSFKMLILTLLDVYQVFLPESHMNHFITPVTSLHHCHILNETFSDEVLAAYTLLSYSNTLYHHFLLYSSALYFQYTLHLYFTNLCVCSLPSPIIMEVSWK